MTQLVIDIGNTRTKLAVFEGRNLLSLDMAERVRDTDLKELLQKNNIQSSIISTVRENIEPLERVLQESGKYIRFDHEAAGMIRNNYKSKQTLGLDRLAGIIGARSLYPAQNCLVIDAGTCITYDAVSSAGEYFGGSISPGLTMRLQAMHTLTGRLPLPKLENYEKWFGDDTQTSMLSGVINGAIAEVKEFINTYLQKYDDLKVLLCGGDANFFDTRLKNSIFAHTLKTEPNLVLIGLNEVILYND